MILLSYEQRERLIKASSKNKELKKEHLDDVIEDLMLRYPYAFTAKAIKNFHNKINMTRFKGFANIDS